MQRRPEKSRPSAFWLIAPIVVPFLRLATRMKIVGRENIPAEGAFVLSPNHYSEIDPVVMGYALWRVGRAPRFLAKASLFRIPVVGAALRATGQIPVERGGATRGNIPLDAAEALVADGRSVIVYPEGSLTRDPGMWPMRGKSGAVRLALEQGIPLIPAAHWGTQGLMARYAKKISVFPPARITVSFGKPLDLSRFAGRPLDGATLTEATDLVMAEITRLLAELRGESPPLSRWDPRKQGQTETGRFD